MNDTLANIEIEAHDVWAAFSVLSRLPVPVNHNRAGERGAQASWAYPLVGSIIGLIAGCVAWLLHWIGTPVGISAATALAVMIVMTGGLHEDGLSDCADGFGGAIDISKRLEIMKDSRIGAFGAAALIVVLLARWSGLETLVSIGWIPAFVALGAASRAPMVVVMWAMPLASPKGMAATVGHAKPPQVAIAMGLTALVCLLCLGISGVFVLVWAVLATIPVCFFAWRAIEGYTGDVLGACQQIGEIAAMASLVAVLT